MEYDSAAPTVGLSSDLDLAVGPLRDERPPRHYPSYGGRIFLTYVPLLPWVKIPYERIDESFLKSRRIAEPWTENEEHFTRKVPQAIARDLGKSGLFRRVRFVGDGNSWREADLRLGGALRSTEFDAYVSSYMLGIPGVLLWLLPIPVGRNAATVELELELSDARGNVLWSRRAAGRSGRLFLLYSSQGELSGEFGLDIYRFGGNDHGIDPNSFWAYHADALRTAMEGAKGSLAEALPEIAARLAGDSE